MVDPRPMILCVSLIFSIHVELLPHLLPYT
uniref:Uncharacterized protein n=1 Tax=Arundo donax TaxID=35708 RepID=A0A0A8Y6S5_ARUDO